ncbi:unnamed protein product [Phyllotreta striolata]|uniref:Uncharacterized protein n=1 Tax=Phyllotreta striolata TaxID=444603 RepID=A0A9N9XLE5_PHYSR|nr:unnamed protein product [Phyllotreta striolata]
MSRSVYFLACFFLLITNAQCHILDKRIILKVRQNIEKAINYIDDNYDKMNEDCLFGVVLSIAIMRDSYRNGSHIMDSSTLNIINKLRKVLQKAVPYVNEDRTWKSMLIPQLWQKNIEYKYNELNSFSSVKNIQILTNIAKYHNDKTFLDKMDACLKDIITTTQSLTPTLCLINGNCWDIFYRNDNISSGYILTHKLLSLQLAKQRNCIIDERFYRSNAKHLCSRMFSEILNGDYFDQLDRMFDLFLEEAVLCGYEGYADFFSNRWLLYILKSQRSSGCFSATLSDDLKTKIKRTTNIFEDGCADHTTGLGLAVLSLYYNFIVKEIFV